jgi:bifunctional DNase/RNase
MGHMELVPARVRRILALPEPAQQGAGVIVETDEKSFLIVVGIAEAQAILRELEGEEAKRPMTHDLFVHALRGFQIQITRVVISSLIDTTFCATVQMQREAPEDGGMREELMLDSRASDSIVLALKGRVPLMVSRQVLDVVEDITPHLKEIPDLMEQFKQALGGAQDAEDEDEPDEWLPPSEEFDEEL